MDIEKEKLVWMYRTMVRIRTFEEKVGEEFAAGKIPGFVHLSSGQEANPAGVCANLRPDDYITSNHRGHGHLIAKGLKLDVMTAEVFGKKTGVNKGKAGSQHLTDMAVGCLGAEGIQGTPVPVAVGAALSAKLRGADQVAVAFIGDGTLNTGRFHEGLNLAAAWKLPLICYCENNIWAESTNIYDVTALTNITDRAVGYGIPGVAVDGNDVLAVYEAVHEAVARARRGEGPTFIEGRTCRRRGHFEGDTHLYRTQEEKDECLKRDPIPKFRKKLIEMEVLTEGEADRIDQEVAEEMDRAVKFAEESPFPEAEEVCADEFA
jgi:TPP-dependent pyruvate/acetoin dehydrogenase alpha subunit